MANLLFEPVTVSSIHWRNPESPDTKPIEAVDGIELPFELSPTVSGQSTEFRKFNLLDPPAGPEAELVIAADYVNWPQEKDIQPVPYFEEVTANPVPRESPIDRGYGHRFEQQVSHFDILATIVTN